MLAKSRVMGWLSTGESLIIIGWSNEPFVWIVEVIEVSPDVKGAVLVGVRKRRTGLTWSELEACWRSFVIA